MLPPELVALLEKCTINRGEELVCHLCGSTSVCKNGKKDGRQRYLCKAYVITAVDKLQNAYLAPTYLGKIEPKHLEQHLSGKFAEDSILVTDSLRAYRTFANNNKIHLRQIPSGRHTSGLFNLGKVNSYHSKMTDFFDRYKEVGSKYLDHYFALFRWQEKGFNSKTTDKVNMLLDMLTKGVPEKVEFPKLKNRPFPFDTKNIVRVVIIFA